MMPAQIADQLGREQNQYFTFIIHKNKFKYIKCLIITVALDNSICIESDW